MHQIVAAFPEGWMSSGQISRDGTFPPVNKTELRLTFTLVSVMKKKYEKENMENET